MVTEVIPSLMHEHIEQKLKSWQSGHSGVTWHQHSGSWEQGVHSYHCTQCHTWLIKVLLPKDITYSETPLPPLVGQACNERIYGNYFSFEAPQILTNNIKHFIRGKTNDMVVFILRMQFISEQLMQNLGSKYILHICICIFYTHVEQWKEMD